VLRASVLLSMGRLDDARALLMAELSAWPDNPDALCALAELERFAGNAKAHRAAIEALLLKDPANADARVSMGDILYDDKNYGKADENYSTVFTLDKKSFTISSTLKSLEETLPENTFFRIHKTFIVNMNYVKMYDRKRNKVILEGGIELDVATRRIDEFLKVISNS